jgi:glycosyltransferase involved in cell wall biosynthesis
MTRSFCIAADRGQQFEWTSLRDVRGDVMSEARVSVVVPSRGGAARLPVLFEALAKQDFADPWEVVVVLDGAVDESARVIDRYAEQIPVRCIELEHNMGRSAALNAGFAEATGDILVRCDDDLVPSASYLSLHATAHRAGPVGAVGLYRNVYPDNSYARAYGRDWDVRFRQQAYSTRNEQRWRYWAGNVSVSRDTWASVGPYDTSFRSYGWEDVDWGYRLHRLGIPVILEPGLETVHRIAATTTVTRSQRAFYAGAAKRQFEKKHDISPSDSGPGTWNSIVRVTASRLNEQRVSKVARVVDSLTPRLPPGAARKLIALSVESAATAGYGQASNEGLI